MTSSNVAFSTLGSAFLAGAAVEIQHNGWMAIAFAIAGILCWAAYDYLP